ncbi:hypothetical protein [Mycobacterium sp.]|uniref:hypothetical protein n=1 Tax=Mycobacterium sp. TaxID=1785 RepID=UPI0025FE8DF2|nr:hypothetical protein [Mycobacterium sp.]
MSKYIGMIWPTGNSGKLRGAAAAWINAGTNFEVNEITGTLGPMCSIAAQQIPEGPAIAAAFGETHRCASAILQQCTHIAAQLTTYASKIDTVHAAIIDLLSRICNPWTGIKEVWEILSHEDEDEIKRIANDIRVIVNQFTAEVDALRQQIARTITQAATILTTMAHYAEKEWDHFLHATDVGRAIDQFGRICGGVVSEAESAVKGMWTLNPLRAVIDPKGFLHSLSGALENLETLTGLDGEQKAEEAWKGLGKDVVHWDDWATNPLKATGESLFDLGTLLLPGGPLSKLSKMGGLAGDLVEAPKGLHLPNPARLPNPAPHDNPPPKNEPPRGGQPAPAPKAGTTLPPYGDTESKTPAVQKPTATPIPRPGDGVAQPGAGHEPALHQPSAVTQPDRPGDGPPGVASSPSTSSAVAPPTTHHPPPPTENSSGGNDSHSSGLSDEKRDEILALPKGSRPDPSDYLSQEYIERHLQKFDGGGTRFMLQENFDRFGIGQRDGTSFVFPTSEVEELAKAGSLGDIEQVLGLPEGYFRDFEVIRIDIGELENYNIRIPSGNEAGANEYWIPGGLLPEGLPEAVIDGSEVPSTDLTIIDLNDFGGE